MEYARYGESIRCAGVYMPSMELSGIRQVWRACSLQGELRYIPGRMGVDEGTCCDEDVYRLDGRQVVPPVTGSLSV